MSDGENKGNISGITVPDLNLLIDLFYLPYEHGDSGKALLEAFRWLKDNSGQVNSNCQLYNDKVSSLWQVYLSDLCIIDVKYSTVNNATLAVLPYFI